MKTVHSYILREILPSFGLCLFFFTFMFLMNQIFRLLDLILVKGVPMLEPLLLYLDLIPTLMAMTVPMATMVATLLAFSRLSSDLEVTAFKGSGMHLGHLVVPVLAFGLLLTGVMVWFNHRVLPNSNYSVKKRTFNIVQSKANVALKERVFIDSFENHQFYIDRINSEGVMEDVQVFSKFSPRAPLWTTLARTGKLVTNPETFQVSLLLRDGTTTWSALNEVKTYNRLLFTQYRINLSLANQANRLNSIVKDKLDMDLDELKSEAAKTNPADIGRIRELRVEYHKRLSLPFACLAVTWFCAPLGLWFRQRGFMASVFGILMIFVYYLIFNAGESMSLRGHLDPRLGLWAANAVFALAGWPLYHMVIHERQAFSFLRFPKGRRA